MTNQKNYLAMRRLSFQVSCIIFFKQVLKIVFTLKWLEKENMRLDLYNAFTRNKKIAMVLDEELARRNKLYKSCLELKHQRKNI